MPRFGGDFRESRAPPLSVLGAAVVSMASSAREACVSFVLSFVQANFDVSGKLLAEGAPARLKKTQYRSILWLDLFFTNNLL